MTDQTDRDRGTTEPQASELEGGGTGQNWGQGEGQHEPTIQPDDEGPGSSYSGSATRLDDPGQPLSREDEGMDR